MSNMNLYNLSNKIRSTLLTTIDKEILNYSKNNYMLINSQNQEQLTKKYQHYREFTVESEESFGGERNNEDNSIFYDLSCSYFHDKLIYYCYSPKNNDCFFPQSFTSGSISPIFNHLNLVVNKIQNSKLPGKNLTKLNIGSSKKLIPEVESSFSCKEVLDFKNSVSLSNNSINKKHLKQFSADLINYTVDNKSDDSSKLINYCNKLKIPNNNKINEISDDDISTNKGTEKNLTLSHKIKNKHKNSQYKKFKKTINKIMSLNKNNQNSDDKTPKSPMKKNTMNFSKEKKFYLHNQEKSDSKDKTKIQSVEKKITNTELKKCDTFHWKNFFQKHHYSTKPPEKQSKEKKKIEKRKSLFIQLLNKKLSNKKSQNLETFFKPIENTPIIIKYKNKKDKKEKKEKKDVPIIANLVVSKQLSQKHFKSSKSFLKTNDEYRKNGIFCFGKKISNNFINERNESSKIKRKHISISISNNNKFINTNDCNENYQN